MKAKVMVFCALMGVGIADEWPKTTIDPAPKMKPDQTAEQINAQKVLAEHPVIANAPEDGKTPRKMFEAYFNAMLKLDASENLFFTPKALKDMLGKEAVTPEDLVMMAEVASEFRMADLQVIRFEYLHDENSPTIKFILAYTKVLDGIRAWCFEGEALTLARTQNGWRIDSWDYLPSRLEPDNVVPSPDGEDPIPGGDGTTPDGDGTTPDGDGTTPDGDGTTPDGDGTTPDGDGANPDGGE